METCRFDAKDVQSFMALLGGTILAVVFFLVLIPSATRWGLEPQTDDQALVLNPGWLDPAEAPAERGRDIPPVDPSEVMNPTATMLARGKGLFVQNCVPCHGEKGAGDGPAAATTNPKPRNFLSPAGWKNGPTLAGIFKTLTQGIQGSSMAAFDTLPPKDRMALVHYVRSLGPFDHGQDDPKALEAMAVQFKSSGGRVPNRIPVSLAQRKLEEEAGGIPDLAVEADPSDAGASLARKVLIDPPSAARFLSGIPGWTRDPDLFARAAAAGAPSNGFGSGVARLDSSEWKSLHAYLSRQMNPERGTR